MNTKHTKGEWELSPSGTTISTKEGVYIAEIYWPSHSHAAPASEAEFNGPLLAAAPELLEALRRTLFYIKDRAPVEYDAALKAIAKATNPQ